MFHDAAVRTVSLLLLCGSAFAQEPPADSLTVDNATVKTQTKESIQLTELTISPRPIRGPALRYSFQPAWTELTEGNAAPLYYRSIILFKDRLLYLGGQEGERWKENQDKLRTESLSTTEARQLLDIFSASLHELRWAVRRRDCDWGLPLIEAGDAPFGILLPDVQESRQLAFLLRTQATLQMNAGSFEEARQTIATGFRLGQHVSEGPFMVMSLVGFSQHAAMLDAVERWQMRKDSPNVFWPLAELSRNAPTLLHTLGPEQGSILRTFPVLRTLSTERTPEQWSQELKIVIEHFDNMSGLANGLPDGRERLTLENVLSRAKEARGGLLAAEVPQSEIDAMSDAEAILRYTGHLYRLYRDQLFVWANVPYPQAERGMIEAARVIETQAKEAEIIPIAQAFLPSVRMAYQAEVRLHRRIAMLQIVEAIRHHMSEHDGQFPASLEDIEALPLPNNPLTGQPFAYRIEEGTALLDATAPGEPRPTRVRLTRRTR